MAPADCFVAMDSLIAGSLAGIIARTIVCPLDVLKIRLQVQESTKRIGIIEELKRLPIRSLWRGNSAGILLYAGYSGVQFGTFSQISDQFGVFPRAALASLTATIFTYPFDVLRTRMAVERSGSLLTSANNVYQQGGFYRGFVITSLQVVPYMGSVFYLHDYFLKQFESEFWAGALSGFVCKTAFLPVDVVRKRLQLLRSDPSQLALTGVSPATNFWQLCGRMWALEGGLRPFFRGWTMAVSKAAPTTAITFFAYEKILEAMPWR